MLVSVLLVFSLISLYLQSPTFRELPTREWKWWKNGSITETLRDHFRRYHGPVWSVVCEEQQLKGHAVQPGKSPSKRRIVGQTVFSIEEVRRRLVEWIVADDQSLRVVDVPEFRRLLLALGAGNILDRDLPRRTGLAKLIAMRHKLEEEVLKQDLQIGQITLDNASNNNTFMSSLCEMIDVTGQSFSAKGNRLRCFPHVINIAVQAMLDRLSKGRPPNGYKGSDGMVVFYSIEYLAALDRDIVGVCRSVVTAMRASGARRLGLWNFIIALNKRNVNCEPIPHLRLLRDCETRWSSCFIMLNRFITLWPAVQGYIRQLNDGALTKHLMGDTELTVLVDVIQVLEGAHAVQQVLSAEKTPTLSNALPAYALLINYWTGLSRSIPQLSYIMDVGIAKIKDYIDQSRSSKIHVLAMAVNPSTKLEWIESNWNSAEARQAKSWVLEHVCLGSIRNLSTVRRSASLAPGIDSPTSSTIHLPVSRENTPVPEPASISQEEQDQADRKTVELELENYMHDGTLESRGLDMVRFWQHHSCKYPTLYRIALDVLPAQASAVPCERAFSSSKETLTKRRNRLSPALVEALQHLKFLVRQQRLNFMLEQDVTEEELSIEERDSQMTVTREMIRGAIESDDPENALQELIEDIEGESCSV
ncbi:hypothetical protein M407DRAFT_83547 [Tulasnella calospora MUT 4182]|uniref:HAT C-terminal dimerisation domain-containing protein n=1 Tax=Tulasnella calospora MUT 4182 TaxID=1051891 RepID=A0A0C3Q698_9AGAM|nr:hypothetical protein M407DRAFT_83547 [Tulasnella calospora MUT 4182]